jgi:hypothetical protein
MNTSINNSTINSSYQYYTTDEIFLKYGSTWALDVLNLYPYITVSSLGVLLSILALIIFQDSEFNTPLYVYMRVMSAVNILQSSLNIFNFAFTTLRIIPISNTYAAQFFFNFIFSPVASTCYFYSSVLGLIILLDRISYFKFEFKSLFIISAYKISAIALAVCIIINSPSFFAYVPTTRTFKLSATETFTIWLSFNSTFGFTLLGKILLIIVDSIRDILVMILEVTLNILSMHLLHKHLNMKRKLHNMTAVTSKELNKTSAVFQAALSALRKKDVISKSDLRATMMTIVMCLSSIVMHVLLAVSIIYPYFGYNINVLIFSFVTNFMLPVKCVVDFFTFYFFNVNFKRVLNRYARVYVFGISSN